MMCSPWIRTRHRGNHQLAGAKYFRPPFLRACSLFPAKTFPCTYLAYQVTDLPLEGHKPMALEHAFCIPINFIVEPRGGCIKAFSTLKPSYVKSTRYHHSTDRTHHATHLILRIRTQHRIHQRKRPSAIQDIASLPARPGHGDDDDSKNRPQRGSNGYA